MPGIEKMFRNAQLTNFVSTLLLKKYEEEQKNRNNKYELSENSCLHFYIFVTFLLHFYIFRLLHFSLILCYIYIRKLIM